MEVFRVRCIGYTQNHERYFTIGKEYEVRDGRITSDTGFEYRSDPLMTKNSNPNDWLLADWYQFEIVDDDVVPAYLEVTFEDILTGGASCS